VGGATICGPHYLRKVQRVALGLAGIAGQPDKSRQRKSWLAHDLAVACFVLSARRYHDAAMAVRATKVWTYDDLLRMPEPTDGKRYEILDGELVVSPSPSTRHQYVSGKVLRALMRATEDAGRGLVYNAPLDVILSRTRVVIPDLVAIRADRLAIVHHRGIFGAPDLVAEILSPSNRRYDRNRKRRLYASSGIPEYWIIDPDADTVEQLVLGERDYVLDGVYEPGDRLRSVVFDFELDVAKLFRR
jgi:Uma2 family endonuclease